MQRGWLVNDCLTCIPGTCTFWHMLLEKIPNLQDMTGGYTPFNSLAKAIETQFHSSNPDSRPTYIIRNATFFRPLKLPVRQISLLQDATPVYRKTQAAVIRSSDRVVVNTAYVASLYKDILPEEKTVVIPLGTDIDLFRPLPGMKKFERPTVLFVGAANVNPKGWDRMEAVMQDERLVDFDFCLVMKAPYTPPKHLETRISVHVKIQQDDIVRLASKCHLGICTSRQETQHLGGIEMMACSLPMVAPPIGIYWDLDKAKCSTWGRLAYPPTPNIFVETLLGVYQERESFNPRQAVLEWGLDKESCFHSWRTLLMELGLGS